MTRKRSKIPKRTDRKGWYSTPADKFRVPAKFKLWEPPGKTA